MVTFQYQPLYSQYLIALYLLFFFFPYNGQAWPSDSCESNTTYYSLNTNCDSWLTVDRLYDCLCILDITVIVTTNGKEMCDINDVDLKQVRGGQDDLHWLVDLWLQWLLSMRLWVDMPVHLWIGIKLFYWL